MSALHLISDAYNRIFYLEIQPLTNKTESIHQWLRKVEDASEKAINTAFGGGGGGSDVAGAAGEKSKDTYSGINAIILCIFN